MKRSAALLAAPLLIAITAVVVSLALDANPADAPTPESAFRGCDPQEAATRDAVNLIPTPTQYGRSGPDPLYGLRTPNPTFTGRLCDFVLVGDPEDADLWQDCTGVRTFYGGDSNMPSPVASELNWDQTEQQFICDGTPTAVWHDAVRRVYFYEDPLVWVGLPREEIAVMEIEGYPVIIGQPPANPSTQVFHAILRLPTAERPGILVSGHGEAKLIDTIELVRAVLQNDLEVPAVGPR